MSNILTIARREVTRFRTRFRGGSRVLVLIIVAVSLLVSFFVAQSGFTLSRGMYTIGVAPDAPPVEDSRFNVIILDNLTAHQRMLDRSIDAYVTADTVFNRNDQRSQYAAGALKQYLENSELGRITDEYELDKAYPLRIETYYFKINSSVPPAPGESLKDLIGVTPVPDSPGQPSANDSTPDSDAESIASNATDAAVLKQIEDARNGTQSRFKAEFVSDREIIVPSLMNPPIPLSQIIIAFLYIVPVFFISVFFTSSFMDEKTNRKLNILMSAPVSAFDIIFGKMLPYLCFALLVIVAVTLLLQGNLFLALAIFIPVVLFIFSIYLMVALFYRTYKDQTFFSMAAITFVTGYLVFPALFAGVNNLSYISPLTLAVQMYRGEPFGLFEYVFSTGPMYLVFLIAMFIGVRIFNEEYLMGYGPLYRKAGDAIYLALNRKHVYISIALLSLLLIPIVFMVELIILALSINIPQIFTMIVVLLFFSALVEEIAKSSGIAMLIEYKDATSLKSIVILSFLSAFGFWLSEKLFLALSIGIMPASTVMDALSGSVGTSTSPVMIVVLLLIPLAAHFVFTSIVCVSTRVLGTRYYFLAILVGTLVHTLYNVYNLHNMGAF